ncbi:MAG TPA: transketolase C-terminal domain-containing protein [Candidatus Paceibacterota bacterium]|nr:transketolase C-terminal domain-containing protein [Candidatus Paceibacterota bacterium]
MSNMIKEEQHLAENIFDTDALPKGPTRDGFGKGLVEAAEKDERVVALCADLAESTRTLWFKEKFPERYIEIGVAEQNLATVASGLANYGKIPFITSYAAFSPGRNNEQIRTTISLNNVPVIIAGAHAGVSVGPDGATHQQLEDIALMRVQPNMTVVVPADVEEARKATIAAASYGKPIYLRFARSGTPIFTTPETPFEIGKANILWDDDRPEAALVAVGPLVHHALLAAKELEAEGIRVMVVNNHTVKPMDERCMIEAAKKAGAVVPIEEHQVSGGMGSAVAEILSQNYPVPMQFVGVHDAFGQSGEPDQLLEYYGMGVGSIKDAVRQVIARKK